jgi:MGT family glycosyltransferase
MSDGADSRLTVLFMPESAYGPTHNCVGIAERLRRKGHRVVFAAERSWAGRLERLGFEEALVDLAPPAVGDENGSPGQFWKEFIRQTSPALRQPAFEQLSSFLVPTWRALIEGARYCQGQLREICDQTAPDVVVQDNVVCFPALLTCGAVFVRIVSCNPLEIRGAGIPPPYSGLPAGDSSSWGAFGSEYDRTHRQLWEDFNDWVQAEQAPPLPDLEFIHTSGDLNLYVYPGLIDYTSARPLDDRWLRLPSSVRETEVEFELPVELRSSAGEHALIYLSLGSLGGADVELMRRLVEVLAASSHRFVVSKGPRHDEYELGDNMWGAELLPQTRILPLVDLVITHGGNNTVTESLHFGKPMLVLPLFWDQHDNAQRLQETGIGRRLDPYRIEAGRLRDEVDRLLADSSLRARLDEEGARIRAADGVGLAATRIVEVARSRAQRL